MVIVVNKNTQGIIGVGSFHFYCQTTFEPGLSDMLFHFITLLGEYVPELMHDYTLFGSFYLVVFFHCQAVKNRSCSFGFADTYEFCVLQEAFEIIGSFIIFIG